MAYYTGSPQTDPDLVQFTVDVAFASSGEEIVIDTTNRTIALKIQGGLGRDGISLKALYSAIKDAWQGDTGGAGGSNRLIKFPFPFTPITDEQFEIRNGWTWDKTNSSSLVVTASDLTFSATGNTITTAGGVSFSDFQTGETIAISGTTSGTNDGNFTVVSSTSTVLTVAEAIVNQGTADAPGTFTASLTQTTEQLIRTGGWTVNNLAGDVVERWFSLISLGTLGTSDQVYYEQAYKDGTGAVTKLSPVNTILTDIVNQGVQFYASLGAIRTDVSFNATGNVITTVGGDVSPFKAGDVIVVDTASNSANDGVFTVASVNTGAGTITVNEQLTTETNVAAGNTTITADYGKYFKLFCREWQKTYASSTFEAIGIDTATTGTGAGPQAYRFPLTNTTDPDIPTNLALTDVATGGAGIVGNILAPYSNVTVDYLRASDGDPYVIKGDVLGSTAYLLGDVVYYPTDGNWYSVDADFTTVATPNPSTDTANFTLYEGQRAVGVNGNKAFTIIIDADTNVGPTASGANNLSVIYRSVQYQLRQNEDIDRGVSSPDGFELAKTSQELIAFVGPTLVTEQGVYIDSFASADNNDISLTTFSNVDGTTAESVSFDFTAQLLITFGQNLIDDTASKYTVFFSNANGNAYGTSSAIIVQDAALANIAGDVNTDLGTPAYQTGTAGQIARSFAYTSNDQGSRTPNTPAAITAVAIGLSTGQFVTTTGEIGRSTTNSISLIAALERNYSPGSV